MKFAILLLSLTLSTQALAFELPTLKLPEPVTEKLPNGMDLVWFQDDALPVIDIVLLLKSGNREDPAGKSGLSELLVATMDRGAGGVSAQSLARSIESLGAERYITASDEAITIGMHGLAPDGTRLLELLSKIALSPDFPKAEFAKEKARIEDRWKHVPDYSESIASVAFQRLMDQGSVYSRGALFHLDEFRKVSLTDLKEFHKKHFTPKNALLMVVGRVDKPEFKKQILSLFSTWKGEPPHRVQVKVSDPRVSVRPNQVLLVDKPKSNQAQVRIGLKAPSLKSPDRYALAVGNAILGESFYSRLNATLRDKLGLTYGVSSSLSFSKDKGHWVISSSTRNETAGKLIQKTLNILKDLKTSGVDAAEIAQSKEFLIGGFPLSVSTLGAVASRWLGGVVFELDPHDLNRTLDRISKVSALEVNAVVKKYLDLSDLKIVVVGDKEAVGKSLSESGFGSFRKIEAKDLL